MAIDSDTFRQNLMLAALPDRELQQVHQHAERVHLHLGEELAQPKEPHRYLHFPLTAAISLVEVPDTHHTVEVTVVGREGCTGSTVIQGDARSISLTLVQIGGEAIRLNVETLLDETFHWPVLRKALARFNYLLGRMAVISVGCSQFHSPAQRLARWLLAHCHRTGLQSFPFTSSFLAAQVGVSSEVTEHLIEEWEPLGIVKKGRNSVDITDPYALTEKACPCFEKTKGAIADYITALENLARHSAS
jgi:CRP-like cAMP-binding protein